MTIKGNIRMSFEGTFYIDFKDEEVELLDEDAIFDKAKRKLKILPVRQKLNNQQAELMPIGEIEINNMETVRNN